MGVLLIRCPKTGRDFSTGIHVDEETLGAGAAGVHSYALPLLQN